MDGVTFRFDSAAKVYSLGIPVYIWSGKFCRDRYEEEIKTQIRILNVSKKKIKEIYVDITAKDEKGNVIDRIENVCYDHIYLDSAKMGKFRQYIEYSVDAAELVFECTRVEYDDESFWDLDTAMEKLDENLRKIREEKAKHIKSTIIFACIFLVCFVLLLYLFLSVIPEYKYKRANNNYIIGQYGAAYKLYEDLGDRWDAKEKALDAKYLFGKDQIENSMFDDAVNIFTELGDYKDSKDMVKEAKYQKGLYLYNKMEYDASNEIFSAMPGYKNSKELIHKHEFGLQYAVVPTCTQPGVLLHICYCGVNTTEAAAAFGHQFTRTVSKDATCTEDGIAERVCEVCGYEEINYVVKATGHNFEKKTLVSPGCISEGVEELHCKTCDGVFEQAIPAKGHRWVEASCITPEACAVCGTTRGAVLPHQWNGNGVCNLCGEKFEYSLKLAGLPLTLKGKYLYDTDYVLTEAGVSYMLEKADGDGFNLNGKIKTVRTGTSPFESSIGPYVYYRVIDEKGNTVYKDSSWLSDREMTIYGLIPKEGTYTLEFSAEPFK